MSHGFKKIHFLSKTINLIQKQNSLKQTEQKSTVLTIVPHRTSSGVLKPWKDLLVQNKTLWWNNNKNYIWLFSFHQGDKCQRYNLHKQIQSKTTICTAASCTLNIWVSEKSQQCWFQNSQLSFLLCEYFPVFMEDGSIRLLSPLHSDSTHSFLLQSVLELRDPNITHMFKQRLKTNKSLF